MLWFMRQDILTAVAKLVNACLGDVYCAVQRALL